MTTESMSYFNEFNKHSLLALENAKGSGIKIAGTYCIFAPTELIRAAGAIPVGLCGKKQEPIAEAEKTLPANLCPLIKSSYGFAAADTCPFFSFADFIIGETTCDGKKKMFELMDQIKSTYVMQLPHTPDREKALEYWTSEVHRVKRFLEEQTGNTVDPAGLRRELALQNRVNGLMERISLLSAGEVVPLSGLHMIKVLESRLFAVDLEQYARDLERLLEELSARAAEGRSACAENAPRILVTGCPTGTGSEKVTQLVEECGGVVVCQENCCGIKGLDLACDVDAADPFEALAARYIKIPCSCMSPNTGRMDLLGKLAETYRVQGVIDLTWTCCHTYNIESHTVGEVMEQHGLPKLQIETDYSESDTEQLRTRIEAFLEILA